MTKCLIPHPPRFFLVKFHSFVQKASESFWDGNLFFMLNRNPGETVPLKLCGLNLFQNPCSEDAATTEKVTSGSEVRAHLHGLQGSYQSQTPTQLNTVTVHCFPNGLRDYQPPPHIPFIWSFNAEISKYFRNEILKALGPVMRTI